MSSIRKNLINGEWKGSDSVSYNVNPSDTQDIIGEYSRASKDDTESAIDAAKAAFPAWRDSTPQFRTDILEKIGLSIIEQKNQLGFLLSREEGKTLAEGIGEVVRAGQIFKFFAQEALRIKGESLASIRPNIDVDIRREPVGVIGIITPWNFPIAIPTWKVAPALAYGNTVVMKPAELVPGCAHVLAEIINEAGCPPGVFNLLNGPGSKVGQALVDHPSVNAVSFTGSVLVGHRLATTAITGMKKIQLEMGGKNPMVIMNDADIQNAIDTCINSAFYSTGQRCTASSRIIVEQGIHDEFVERMVKATLALRVGDAVNGKTQIGPVVSEQQLLSNLDYVNLASQEGAEVAGGGRLDLEKKGFYQTPALFVGANNDMRIAREEIFGPCATVIRADNFDHALAISNDTEFGLAAGICTTNLNYAREFKRQAEVGMVMVNIPTAGVDYHVPFGGRKASSYGSREQGQYASEFFTVIKTAYTA